MSSTRTEQVYISRGVKQGFEALALLASSEAGDDVGLVCIDAMIDQVLREHLDTVPALAERRKAIRDALKQINERFAGAAKGAA